MMLIIGVAIDGSQNRSEMLAFAIPTVIAIIFASNRKMFLQLALQAAVFAIVADVNIEIGGGRKLQFDQFAANASLFTTCSEETTSVGKEFDPIWRKPTALWPPRKVEARRFAPST
jgi:hypothetical protein